MTPDAWFRIGLGILSGACLGWAFAFLRQARRLTDEADEIRKSAKQKLDEVSDLLAHMMRDHGVLHSPHSHDDDSPTLQ